MTITVDELRKLLDSATPGPWVWREDEWGSHSLVHWVEGETFASGAPRYIEVHSDGSANGEYGPSIDVDGPEAALIAIAPTLARRVIAAEKLVEALDACIASLERADTEEGVCCCGDDMATHGEPINCGHIPVDMGDYYAGKALDAARAALAEYEATK